MTPRALLDRLQANGVTVSATPDGQLHLDGDDAAALSPELEEALRLQRAQVLALLAPVATPPRRKRPPTPAVPRGSTLVSAPPAGVPAPVPLPGPPPPAPLRAEPPLPPVAAPVTVRPGRVDEPLPERTWRRHRVVRGEARPRPGAAAVPPAAAPGSSVQPATSPAGGAVALPGWVPLVGGGAVVMAIVVGAYLLSGGRGAPPPEAPPPPTGDPWGTGLGRPW
jgi:hypothetical protein